MGKAINTAIAIGAGVVAVSYMQKNNMMSQKQLKKVQRKVMKMF
ncbi:YrzQ family protein [Bacillus circulans]|nr:YrzQ family protein [Niallia circulans]NRG28140.1 YrzQ family protein [Niallia circulans]